jgi:hypothetical protein
MAIKKVIFNKSGIKKIPNDKPAVYQIKKDESLQYAGVAKKGRVQQRLKEHLPNKKDAIKGNKVEVKQKSSIKQALKEEAKIIKSKQPPKNKKGK